MFKKDRRNKKLPFSSLKFFWKVTTSGRPYFLLIFFLLSGSLKSSDLKFFGGFSGGLFYKGADNTSFNFKVNNLLLGVSIGDEKESIKGEVAFGGTVTPSLLENSEEFYPTPSIQYAYFSIGEDNINFEMGILPPVSGYEDTYTYNNRNITVGIVASQQPFNAIGGRVNLKKFVDLSVGIYRDRLDPEEYCYGNKCPSTTYEIFIGKEVKNVTLSFYHYHINNIRNLTGLVIELEKASHYFAINTDYWKWVRSYNYSVATALYYSYSYKDSLEIPLRIEYVFRNGGIYINAPDNKRVFALTITPTLHLTDSTFIRFEAGYVRSKDTFEKNNSLSSFRRELSFEMGFVK